jgi:hypothetical protein
MKNQKGRKKLTRNSARNKDQKKRKTRNKNKPA